MKLYTYDPAPNPRRLAMFMNYKGIEIETEQVDLMTAAQLGDEYVAINPEQTVPALVLDDGNVLTEVIGMCTYLEALHPDKPLLGTTPLEKARVISWDHKLFNTLMQSVASMLRNRGDAFKDRALPGPIDVPQIPEMIDRGRIILQHTLPSIDAHLANNQWLAGDNVSFADIDLLVGVDFLAWVKQSVPDECNNLKAWYERASAELA